MDFTSRPPLASILVRLGAVLVDGLLVWLICVPMGIGTAVIAGFTPESIVAALGNSTAMTVLIFLFLLTEFGLLCYSALILGMWAYGLTPGKYLLGIRVIKSDTGLPASFWRMLLRETIGRWVSAFLCALGYIWAIFDANKQGWHDKIAKTLVIRTR